MIRTLDNRAAGAALLIGYALLAVVLFRNPSSSVPAATATVRGAFFFLALPLLGFASGLYAYFDGPFNGTLTLVTSTYLGAVGVALALLLRNLPVALNLVGVVLFALAAVALVSALRGAVAALGLTDMPI